MSEKKFFEPKASNIRKTDHGSTLVDIQMVEKVEEKKVKKPIITARTNHKITISCVQEWPSKEGYFLIDTGWQTIKSKTIELDGVRIVAPNGIPDLSFEQWSITEEAKELLSKLDQARIEELANIQELLRASTWNAWAEPAEE